MILRKQNHYSLFYYSMVYAGRLLEEFIEYGTCTCHLQLLH